MCVCGGGSVVPSSGGPGDFGAWGLALCFLTPPLTELQLCTVHDCGVLSKCERECARHEEKSGCQASGVLLLALSPTSIKGFTWDVNPKLLHAQSSALSAYQPPSQYRHLILRPVWRLGV